MKLDKNKRWFVPLLFSIFIISLFLPFNNRITADEKTDEINELYKDNALLGIPKNLPQRFFYDSGVDIPYPKEGVKGIYTAAHNFVGKERKHVLKILDQTKLNALVLDVKDDSGFITLPLKGLQSKYAKQNTRDFIPDTKKMMKTLEKHQVYPIARIVVFKDTILANERPDLSFKNADGSLWTSGGGDSFVSPFKKEIWDYNVDVAIAAAKAGFKEIQFDYVRFPEGFETFSNRLYYDTEGYSEETDGIQQRVEAVTDFVAYAHKKLQPYGVKVGVDIFGYAATIPEAPGIGQNFSKISNNVDVISSMIYPSHWGLSYFGIENPDLHPYELVQSYMVVENQVLSALDNPPISRPWLQDFTASYLGPGRYLEYGPEEVSLQIQALREAGVNEYLLWNVQNSYSTEADY
ncbi:putative glycoside hydrolase [Atopobacter phocae]|uniref:putative glycoside hydrolase n=1 Tax=Atopobacter phocae TaxID=136492 RepID=UPI0004B4B7D3|nr:putative glycoside hydrolase [Atopobacter phocae]